ncbi:MAG TPA: bifunctional hydroxymethylpyrimidine kinase/phosphomethylpyrimidine kinase [Candidatus Hydrogenedentes bacterium]|jgi:hydroxymethylpyrimidine/phosphomethylpyrimidine kinase|nr:bifunctional hydroxymethylpyrimidine kinase/phosphomethylpyrimidine kinase [Candidatus Hydrogenedentota bacterium]MDY0032266.1 bifunctional hydroxymethylpyrimidine kinase/phosphomethylpyrimidine kinase [FCB group bacterium]NLT62370.1 bifunctional hydroxymethylpyrimidine kinase/phosphomethylpyrimidine kinase [Candidatus Hydrogenedentota bacterium]HNV20950.1 bifunctional hydroxymethylpyrimidine kinase/phosphomethylpyrimidine kinase [Candidatus Hydrogenedentota bacterium]HNZ19582.1 bifunctional
MPDTAIPCVLTIAGSDSGGGAGIQADLKTFTALRVFGMAAITSVTAQNTVGVTGVHDLPPEFVAEQIDDVARDIGVDAAKTGMLSSAAIVEAVADSVARNSITRLVVDPVMVAKSGDPLLQESARQAMRKRILPLAWLVTPNVPEAEVLAGVRITGPQQVEQAARNIHRLGARYVLLKGGHMEGENAVDYLYDGQTIQTFSAPRIATRNTHGTGCTYSAAIAAYLARGCAIGEAVQRAKAYLTGAIQHSFPLGAGHGPLNHFWRTDA